MVVKDKLKSLYQLQQVDLKLDGLLEERGDLPAEVGELEKKITALKAQIKENEDYLKKAVVRKKEIDKELDEIRKRIDKYTDMRIKVKTNREYDALSKQIDNSKEKLQALHKELEGIQTKETTSARDVEKLKQEFEEEDEVYSSKKVELEELVSLTHDEEKRYVKEREKFAQKIDRQSISRYEMIRKATRGKQLCLWFAVMLAVDVTTFCRRRDFSTCARWKRCSLAIIAEEFWCRMKLLRKRLVMYEAGCEHRRRIVR